MIIKTFNLSLKTLITNKFVFNKYNLDKLKDPEIEKQFTVSIEEKLTEQKLETHNIGKYRET